MLNAGQQSGSAGQHDPLGLCPAERGLKLGCDQLEQLSHSSFDDFKQRRTIFRVAQVCLNRRLQLSDGRSETSLQLLRFVDGHLEAVGDVVCHVSAADGHHRVEYRFSAAEDDDVGRLLADVNDRGLFRPLRRQQHRPRGRLRARHNGFGAQAQFTREPLDGRFSRGGFNRATPERASDADDDLVVRADVASVFRQFKGVGDRRLQSLFVHDGAFFDAVGRRGASSENVYPSVVDAADARANHGMSDVEADDGAQCGHGRSLHWTVSCTIQQTEVDPWHLVARAATFYGARRTTGDAGNRTSMTA